MRGFHNCNFFVCQAVELAESIFKFVFIIIIYFSIFFISSINKSKSLLRFASSF